MSENLHKTGPIRVLLADDHTMFRQGLAGVLASYPSIEVIADVPNDADALKLARELSPDVVIMQVQLPVDRAVETLKAMRAFPEPQGHNSHHVREPALHQGVNRGGGERLLKTTSSDHLVAAVRAAVLDPGEGHRRWDTKEMLESTQEGRSRRPLRPGARDPASRRPRPLQRADSLLAPPCRGDRKAPPGQRLPEDGRPLQGRGFQGGTNQGVDHHRGGHRRDEEARAPPHGAGRGWCLGLVNERVQVVHARVLCRVGSSAPTLTLAAMLWV